MNRHIINENALVIDALAKLNNLSGSVMTLFVTDSEGKVLGTLTDGDIRRGLLDGAQPADRVSTIMHRDFRAITTDSDTVAKIREYRRSGLRLIPHIDASGKLVEIIDTTVTATRLPISAILMAGGKGERLRPLTLTTPKPLLEVAGQPIIDYNVRAMAASGITDIYVTVNYLADKIEQHFAEPVGTVQVRCIIEPQFLGTIGSAALAPLPEQGDTLVMNSDLLTDISIEDMYLHHRDSHADITVASIPYKISVPYAILSTTEGGMVSGLSEKPTYTHYANAGIYIVSNHLLKSLPTDRRTDATDLIENVIVSGGRVTYFPITGTWIDIGSPSDYARANEMMSHSIK